MMPDIPPFLVCKPGDTRTVFCGKPDGSRSVMTKDSGGIHPPYHLTLGPIAKANLKRIEKGRSKYIARPLVMKAVKSGADTFGKIRQDSGVEEDKLIRSALRYFVKNSRIEKVGRRYYASF